MKEQQVQIYTLPSNDLPQDSEKPYVLPTRRPPILVEDDIRTINSETFNNFSDIMNVVKGHVKSGNFITGISGWQIDANGNVEFNNGTFRGNFQIGGTLITVSDINDLQDSIDTVEAAGGGTVALVPDVYTGTTSFTIPSSVVVDGNGSVIDFGGGAFQFLIQGTNAYSTGTLAVNYGSTALVGTGTTWIAGMVGQFILIGDYWYEITARTDNTHITIGSPYIGTNITGASYIIATTVDAVGLKNITLTNSSTSALRYRYVNGFNIEAVLLTDSTQGIDGDDSANVNFILGSGIDNCVTGMTVNNNPFMIIDGVLISNITGGTALDLNGVSNTSMGSISIQGITGVGLKFTNCYNIGFVNYSIIETTSHGIELVSVNTAIDLISGYIDTTGGDGIKLTATSDGISIDTQTIKNYTGYGVNIAASSCDNNSLGHIDYGGGGSGMVNDGGTLTMIGGTNVQTFTSSGTWTKPKNGTQAFIQCWGAGGGGGKASAGNSAAGGGGGAYTERWIPLSSLGATETVTIGAGGATQTTADTAGNVGGDTTFGAFLTAYGGGGGASTVGAGAGGGGGGGASGAGASGSGDTGGNGGQPQIASSIGTGGAATVVGTLNIDGGGGGGGRNASGGNSIKGGGGGGGSDGGAATGGNGGNSFYGGGGGGGASDAGTPGSGGSSTSGGAGGAGATGAANATAGTQPGGGGGGAETGNGAAGAAGKVMVTVV